MKKLLCFSTIVFIGVLSIGLKTSRVLAEDTTCQGTLEGEHPTFYSASKD